MTLFWLSLSGRRPRQLPLNSAEKRASIRIVLKRLFPPTFNCVKTEREFGTKKEYTAVLSLLDSLGLKMHSWCKNTEDEVYYQKTSSSQSVL